MDKVLGMKALLRSFRMVFDDVARRQRPHILAQGGRPDAVLISYDERVRFQEFQGREILDRFGCSVERAAAQNEVRSEEDVESNIRKAGGKGLPRWPVPSLTPTSSSAPSSRPRRRTNPAEAAQP